VTAPADFITLKDVSLRLNDRVLFEHTTWTLKTDEQWAVVGPNGSGKSTLMNALAGRLPVVEGDISYILPVRGRHPRLFYRGDAPEEAITCVSIDAHRQLVGRAIEYHQARWSPVDETGAPTVRATIEEACDHRPFQTCRDVARRLGIDYLLDRQIIHLSNGEVRKVLIARALVRRPELLILDNPFAGLDRSSRAMLKTILNRLMQSGMRIIVVTQRVDEIPARTTHLLYVEDNRVAAMGRKRVLLRSGIADRLERAQRRKVHAAVVRIPSARCPARSRHDVIADIRHASVTYGDVRILNDVSWTVRRGEHWVLLGPNGSGKSTLLSLILGDNPQAWANHIEVFGWRREPGHGVWEIKQRIGWLSPELQYHYPADVDAYRVVCSGHFGSVGLYQDCSAGQHRMAREWMRGLGILDLANRPFGLLSDGQQRMVLLARAMVKNPPLVILDEPCQGLDAAHRRLVVDIVDQIGRRTGSTLVYVTHHADEIPRCMTHTLRLRNGRVTRGSGRGVSA
jgi:molybdate transport system ATP-binding protein